MSGTEAGGLASAPVAASGVSRIALTRPMVRIAQLVIGVILLWASLGKIGDMSEFAREVHNFHLAPKWAENLVAMTLPWVELLAGIALVLGVRARAGAVVTFALMVGFTIAVGAAWARGLDFRCGCFGKASAMTVGPQKFFENVGLTVMALLATLKPR